MTTENLSAEKRPGPEDDEAERPLPAGYRQGVITAISVTLGFSLYFVRFWSLEAAGEWTLISLLASVPILLSVAFLSVALWRSLQVADDNERVYRRTLRWFLWGIAMTLVGVVAASVVSSDTLGSDQGADSRNAVCQGQEQITPLPLARPVARTP